MVSNTYVAVSDLREPRKANIKNYVLSSRFWIPLLVLSVIILLNGRLEDERNSPNFMVFLTIFILVATSVSLISLHCLTRGVKLSPEFPYNEVEFSIFGYTWRGFIIFTLSLLVTSLVSFSMVSLMISDKGKAQSLEDFIELAAILVMAATFLSSNLVFRYCALKLIMERPTLLLFAHIVNLLRVLNQLKSNRKKGQSC